MRMTLVAVFNDTAKKLRKLGVAALAAVNLCAVASEPQLQAAATVPAPSQSIYSAKLKEIEVEANKIASPRQVIVLDQDQMMIDVARDGILPRYSIPQKLQSYHVMLDQGDLDVLRGGFGSNHPFDPFNWDPQAVRAGGNICIVAPQTADLSTQTLSQKYIGINSDKWITGVIEPWAQMLRATYHEVWHCADNVYMPAYVELRQNASENTRKYSYALHRAEMFAEIASALTMETKGFHAFNKQQADIRALRAVMKGADFARAHGKGEIEYYQGAIYNLTPGIDAVTLHVNRMGIEKVKTYTSDDIRRVAIELTEKTALSEAAFLAMTDYFRNGDTVLQRLQKSTSPADADALRAIQSMIDRGAEAAKSRLNAGGKPYREPREDFITALEHWDKLPDERKADLKGEVDRRKKAMGDKYTPEGLVFSMLDDMRRTLHHEKDPTKIEVIETRILDFRAMIAGNALGLFVHTDPVRAPVAESVATPVPLQPPAPAPSVDKPAAPSL